MEFEGFLKVLDELYEGKS
jgi:hypothetical protein